MVARNIATDRISPISTVLIAAPPRGPGQARSLGTPSAPASGNA
jgi:hypothetical protein